MGMTMTQKILAAHAGLESVQAGQLIRAKLDMVLGNDITSPVAVNVFEGAGFDHVFNKQKVAMVMDHFAPNKDIKAAEQCKQCRTFAHRMGVENFYDTGDMGVEHALLPEKGLVAPGELIIGADSHLSLIHICSSNRCTVMPLAASTQAAVCANSGENRRLSYAMATLAPWACSFR